MSIVREVFTRNLHIYLTEDGIVFTKTLPIPPGASELELAKENMLAIEEFTGETQYPLINHLPNYAVSNEARQFYSNYKPLGLCAGMVTNSFITKVLANFFLNFNKLQIPMKVFSNEEDAIKWAKSFINRSDF